MATKIRVTTTHRDFNGFVSREVAIDLIDTPAYQRTLLKGWPEDIAANWNPLLFRPPTLVAKEDGRYDVVDGHHSVEAAKKRGHTQLPVMVYEGLSYAEAAGDFSDLNTRRKRPTPYDIFVADRAAGRRWALQLDAIAKAHEVTVSQAGGPTNLRCVGKARSILERGPKGAGEILLKKVLWVLTSAYPATDPDNSGRLDVTLVAGLADLIRRVPDFDTNFAIRKLSKATFTVYKVTSRVTPANFLNTYASSRVASGDIPASPIGGGDGKVRMYGQCFSLAIFSKTQTKLIYG